MPSCDVNMELSPVLLMDGLWLSLRPFRQVGRHSLEHRTWPTFILRDYCFWHFVSVDSKEREGVQKERQREMWPVFDLRTWRSCGFHYSSGSSHFISWM